MTLRLGRPAVTQLASWFGAKPYPPEDRDEAQDEDRGEAGEDGEAAEARPKVPDPDETRVYLGAGGIVGPEFEGSEDYEVSPFPLIRVENLYGFSLRGPAIDYELIRERFKTTGLGLRAGPSVGVDFGRDEDDNDALRGLGDIDTSVLVGGFARVNFGPVLLRVSGGQDVADGHGGALVESRFGVYLPIGDLRVSPGISATWASEDYMQSVFGVTAGQAARSVYAPYSPDSGFKDVGVDLNLGYQFAEDWSATLLLSYKRLLGEAADSPIVEGPGGSKDQLRGLLGVSYQFSL